MSVIIAQAGPCSPERQCVLVVGGPERVLHSWENQDTKKLVSQRRFHWGKKKNEKRYFFFTLRTFCWYLTPHVYSKKKKHKKKKQMKGRLLKEKKNKTKNCGTVCL